MQMQHPPPPMSQPPMQPPPMPMQPMGQLGPPGPQQFVSINNVTVQHLVPILTEVRPPASRRVGRAPLPPPNSRALHGDSLLLARAPSFPDARRRPPPLRRLWPPP